MKITINHYDEEVIWSNNRENKLIDETNVEEAFNAFKGLLVCLGYSLNGIEQEILEQSYFINEKEKEKM